MQGVCRLSASVIGFDAWAYFPIMNRISCVLSGLIMHPSQGKG